MQFVIIGYDSPDGQVKRPLYRQAHLQRLEELAQQGRLILAGPFADRAGSLILMEADSLEDATRFANNDPYTVHGVFDRVEVHPFKPVFSTDRVSRESSPSC